MGLRRLRRDRHDTADRRRAAVRGRRRPRRRARARRGRGQRQRDAGRGAPLRARHVDRLRARAARARTRAAPRRKGSTSRSRSRMPKTLPYPTGELRRRPLDVRRHVRARPRAVGQRDAARVPARRPHRPRVVDAGRLPRPALQGHRHARAATARRALAAAVGHDAHLAELFARRDVDHAHGSRISRSGIVQPEHFVEVFRDVLRPGPQGVRGARRRSSGRARGRSARRCCASADRGDAAGLVVPAEYLETVITR